MKPALFWLAVSAACLVYWVAAKLPWAPEARAPNRRRLLQPLEPALSSLMDEARLPFLTLRMMLNACALAAAGGAALVWRVGSPILVVACSAVGGALPVVLLQMRIRWRERQVQAAAGPALGAIARVCAVKQNPVDAVQGALPLLQQPLRGEFEQALRRVETGWPLVDALRVLATRCCRNFYLAALAELVAGVEREGGDLAAGVRRLLERRTAAGAARGARGTPALALGAVLAFGAVASAVPRAPAVGPGAVVLLAAALGLATYALLRPSPRQAMIRRLGAPLSPPAPWAPSVYAAAALALLQAAPWLLFGRPVAWPGVAAALAAGAALPLAWRRLAARRRRALLDRAFPDLLTLAAARIRMGADSVVALAGAPPALCPPLREEAEALARDLEAGAPLTDALDRFDARCGAPGIHAAVRRIKHELQLGITLAAIIDADELA